MACPSFEARGTIDCSGFFGGGELVFECGRHESMAESFISCDEVTMKSSSMLAFVGTLLLITFVPLVRAETPFDFTYCVAGPARMLSASDDLLIFGVELDGVTMSNHANKVFDEFNAHFLGIARMMGGQVDANGYYKLTDPDGNVVFAEATNVGPAGKTTWKWKFFRGTGKWKGITGSAIVDPITKRSPLVEGTWRGCNRVTGTFDLPK